jgi:hypothetical protein
MDVDGFVAHGWKVERERLTSRLRRWISVTFWELIECSVAN